MNMKAILTAAAVTIVILLLRKNVEAVGRFL